MSNLWRALKRSATTVGITWLLTNKSAEVKSSAQGGDRLE